MATYEAYVALGDATISISTVDVPLTVRSEQADVLAPMVVLTLLMPATSTVPPRVRLIERTSQSPGWATDSVDSEEDT